jgi:hypothetical protein
MPSTVYDATKTVQDYAGLAVRYGKKAIDVRPAHYGMPTLMPNTYDPSRGITYFNAMIGEANYFNSRPADPEKQLIGAGFREIFCGSHGKRGGTGGAERSAIPTARSATACSAASTSTPAIP